METIAALIWSISNTSALIEPSWDGNEGFARFDLTNGRRFNRTILGWKQVDQYKAERHEMRFNRTILGWKPGVTVRRP